MQQAQQIDIERDHAAPMMAVRVEQSARSLFVALS
jgi:hypothetical protein